jgi:hypothetical protein
MGILITYVFENGQMWQLYVAFTSPGLILLLNVITALILMNDLWQPIAKKANITTDDINDYCTEALGFGKLECLTRVVR